MALEMKGNMDGITVPEAVAVATGTAPVANPATGIYSPYPTVKSLPFSVVRQVLTNTAIHCPLCHLR